MPENHPEQKLIELETRLIFQEEAIEALNRALLDQQKEIGRMALEIEHLRDRLKAATPSPLESDEPELPPHY